MAKMFGAILAGGKGSRLGGADKARLTLGRRSFLERSRHALSAAERIAVAGGRRVADAGDLPCLPDPITDKGPLAGLAAGLAWAEAEGADWLMTAPVDAPFLQPALYAALADALGDDGAVAVVGARAHWLTAIWRVGLAAAAAEALAGDDVSIARFARAHAVEHVALPDASAMFLNVNTPQDLAAAEAAYRSTESDRR